MLKTLALTLTLAASAALLPSSAGAMPLDQGLKSAAGDEVTLVREGCGPGRQYSNRLRRCVEDSPRAMIRDITRGGDRDRRDVGRGDRDRCGPGRHYSRRFDRCVRN
jgi:hypothetical protein